MKGLSVALKSNEEFLLVGSELKKDKSNLLYCLWLMQYETALRISDALNLRYSDFAGSHLVIKQEKTGNIIRIKITDTMRKLVDMRRMEQPGGSDFLFCKGDSRSKGLPITRNTAYMAFGKMARRAGFNDVGTHTPRKTKGRVMYEAGIKLEQIARHLGQTDVRSTMSYIGLTSEGNDLLTDDFSLSI